MGGRGWQRARGAALAARCSPPQRTSWEEGANYTSVVQYWVAANLRLVSPAGLDSEFEVSALDQLEGGNLFLEKKFRASLSLNTVEGGLPNSRGRNVVIGPFSRVVGRRVTTQLQFNGAVRPCDSTWTCSSPPPAALVSVTWVSEVFCFDCPVGSRAIPCDPRAGRSTQCEPCDSNVTSGRYCTGAHGPYNVPSSGLTYFVPSKQVMAGQGYSKNGTYSFAGAPATAECEAGFTCHAGQRVECPGFFFLDDPDIDLFDILNRFGDRPAIFCPRGSRAATPDELLCPAGSFCPTIFNARPCPVGGACPAGSPGPRRCPAGSSSAVQGQAACRPCEPGTFQNATGQASCKSCADESPAGVSPAGATACTACNPLESTGVKFNQCICKPGASGVTCEPSASPPVSKPPPVSNGGNGGAATGGGASPGGALATGRAAAGGSSAGTIVAGCVAALALVAIAVFAAKRQREASATKQPAPDTELSAQQQEYDSELQRCAERLHATKQPAPGTEMSAQNPQYNSGPSTARKAPVSLPRQHLQQQQEHVPPPPGLTPPPPGLTPPPPGLTTPPPGLTTPPPGLAPAGSILAATKLGRRAAAQLGFEISFDAPDRSGRVLPDV